MTLGITLLFRENKIQTVSGVLKSMVIAVRMKDFYLEVEKRAAEISKFYDYQFMGVNDIFVVTGNVVEGEILGKTNYWKLDTLRKSKSLMLDELSFGKDNDSEIFNCSLLYFCENNEGDKYTILVLTVVNATNDSVLERSNSLAQSPDFIQKIKMNSKGSIKKLFYAGVQDVCNIDLKFGVFQSLYSNLDSLDDLLEEVMEVDDIKERLNYISLLK